ncbi:ATP phosphoribosyltransferase regulatory subunit [Longirhabdus pacifica]|uniref:ATP phosphoribosyltransferase regulatory subunit n=1 Tax=Longirhabdus pacifica TaxID=2305227 RepID=UPI001008E6C7|nr:ATP phosphoribosyltransferase regulatory subunit [Longirhabdus pacifica]
MNKPEVFEKPVGFKDYLPETVTQLRKIEYRVLQCIEQWGYQSIMTPTLEYYDTVGVASSTSDSKLFKLLDRNGTTMVLRSEMTTPIARVVSSLLKKQPYPIRLSYHANVFRAMDDEAGKESEFYQTGAEYIGDDSAEADAEIIALSIASLKAAGIDEFKVSLGHVGYLRGLFHEALDEDTDQISILEQHLLNRNYVGYKSAVRDFQIPLENKKALEAILRLRGGKEICNEAMKYVQYAPTKEALSHLCDVWNVLEDYGVADYVMIDLTMIGDFSYYTGMTFESYASGLGFPVCSGGRYDNLLSHFARQAPATGFALKTNRILEVIQREKEDDQKRTLILYDHVHRNQALQLAVQLRQESHHIVETGQIRNGESAHQVDTKEQWLQEEGTYKYRNKCYEDVILFLEQES